MIRDIVLLPLLVLYMASLVLAAWPKEIRPSFMDGVSTSLFSAFGSVGIRADMPVFVGSQEVQSSIIRSECIVVEGWDFRGKAIRLFPIRPCPPKGFRWKPEIYDHMISHWAWKTRQGANASSNLWALGDHFCHQAPDQRIRNVSISREFEMLDYETGREWTTSEFIGRVTCRSRVGS